MSPVARVAAAEATAQNPTTPAKLAGDRLRSVDDPARSSVICRVVSRGKHPEKQQKGGQGKQLFLDPVVGKAVVSFHFSTAL